MISLSLVEVEYCTLMEGTDEVVWLRRFLNEIPHIELKSIIVYCNNVRSIKMAGNPIFHVQIKHIECHYHFVQEKVLFEEVDIKHVPSTSQQAYLLTKLLGRTKFESLQQQVGII
jgi:hypothetical protein